MKTFFYLLFFVFIAFHVSADISTDEDMETLAQIQADKYEIDSSRWHDYYKCFNHCMMLLCVECLGEGSCDKCTHLKDCKNCNGICKIRPGNYGPACTDGCTAYAIKCAL